MVPLGVDLLAEGKQVFGTNIGTQTAALAGLPVNGQFGHGFRLLIKW
jgi:hypothetical protein